MNFNKHSMENKNAHAFLSPSKYHWINYDDDKLARAYRKQQAVIQGTLLHDLACRCIMLGQKLPDNGKTLNMYVNDAIGYKMQPEQLLYYSENCFGTADAISFRNKELRIHDLKTGTTKTHMEQLMVYAALFCLEYKKKPGNIKIELRIYQNNEVLVYNPEVDEIAHIMDKIISFDKIINEIKSEGE